ncbi:MAG: DUF4276 family protein [Planctomycetia bacterium]|nr:DUF4276 family protein [Planctomycetia bacterium]
MIAVVEGHTERSFIDRVLAPWLGAQVVFMTARLVGAPGHKGGGLKFVRARNDILRLLKQEPQTVVTTMFDFYGMLPEHWPGRKAAAKLPHDRKAATVEKAIQDDIVGALKGLDPSRILPYVQMYEFEALLFSSPEVITDVVGRADATDKLNSIRAAASTPEEINDGDQTHPSKRLQAIFPEYQKPVHGVLAAERIGIDAMRAACPHFAEWTTRLKDLSGKSP